MFTISNVPIIEIHLTASDMSDSMKKTLLTSGSATTKYIYSELHYNYNFIMQVYTKTIC
jgi:hypothetical protein